MPADPATLKLRYPAFADVPDATVTYWLTDADRFVSDDWGDDADIARMALAAHNMTINEVAGIKQPPTSQIPAGVTRFRSASMDVAFSEAVANRSVVGGYSATRYGQEFATLLRRHRGGPRLVGMLSPCW